MSETLTSQLEEDMMILCHQAFANGELHEKPLASSDDMKFWIGVTPWSNGQETFTIPDLTFKEAWVLVYFDGHPHYSRTRSRRDDAICHLLTAMGYTVLRFLYRKNSKRERMSMLKTIVKTVNQKIKYGWK